MIMLNFWSRQDGESACEQLETEFPSIEFKVSENLVKEEDEVRMEEIVEKVDAGKDVIEKIVEEKKEHSCQNVVAEESQSVMKIGGNDNRVTGIFIPQLSTVAPVLQSVPLTKAQPLLIHRGKVPTFRRNDYSDSK